MSLGLPLQRPIDKRRLVTSFDASLKRQKLKRQKNEKNRNELRLLHIKGDKDNFNTMKKYVTHLKCNSGSQVTVN